MTKKWSGLRQDDQQCAERTFIEMPVLRSPAIRAYAIPVCLAVTVDDMAGRAFDRDIRARNNDGVEVVVWSRAESLPNVSIRC